MSNKKDINNNSSRELTFNKPGEGSSDSYYRTQADKRSDEQKRADDTFAITSTPTWGGYAKREDNPDQSDLADLYTQLEFCREQPEYWSHSPFDSDKKRLLQDHATTLEELILRKGGSIRFVNRVP